MPNSSAKTSFYWPKEPSKTFQRIKEWAKRKGGLERYCNILDIYRSPQALSG